MQTIIIIGIMIIIIIILCSNKSESFNWDPLWLGKISPDCYGETPRSCLAYSNCGVCTDTKSGSFMKKCVPGDVDGPYFTSDCDRWTYTNYYDKRTFGERTTNTTPVWNKRYPDYEIWYPSPISWSTLQ